MIEREQPDVVLTDLRMPGMELTQRIQERWPDLPVMLCTAHATVDRRRHEVRGPRRPAQADLDR